MKTIKLLSMMIVLFYLVIPLCAGDNPATFETPRKEVWKAFNQTRLEKFGKLLKINLYAESDSLSAICFICEKGLFVYYHNDSNNKGLNHIEPVEHAKLLVYSSINRITYDSKDKYFELWSNGTKELSIGCGNK